MSRTDWTFLGLREVISDYDTVSELREGNILAYDAARNSPRKDELFQYLDNEDKWSDRKLGIEARKYKTRADFQRKSRSAYNMAHRKGLLSKVCQHMPTIKIPRSYDSLQQEAFKYESKAEFAEKDPKAYGCAVQRKILHEICAHYPKTGNWAKRCVYELSTEDSVYIGITYNFEKRVAQHFANQRMGEGVRFKARKLTDYIPTEDAVEMEKSLIKQKRACPKVRCLNKSIGGGLGREISRENATEQVAA